MRSLALASVLFLGLGFQLLSQQETGAFYYEIPAKNSEVNISEVNIDLNNDARGGYLAQNFSDILDAQNSNESESSETTYKDIYYAFDLALDSENDV